TKKEVQFQQRTQHPKPQDGKIRPNPNNSNCNRHERPSNLTLNRNQQHIRNQKQKERRKEHKNSITARRDPTNTVENTITVLKSINRIHQSPMKAR
ncbi:hypothetical protein L9F63_015983, partial [Diploptera punctata]